MQKNDIIKGIDTGHTFAVTTSTAKKYRLGSFFEAIVRPVTDDDIATWKKTVSFSWREQTPAWVAVRKSARPDQATTYYLQSFQIKDRWSDHVYKEEYSMKAYEEEVERNRKEEEERKAQNARIDKALEGSRTYATVRSVEGYMLVIVGYPEALQRLAEDAAKWRTQEAQKGGLVLPPDDEV